MTGQVLIYLRLVLPRDGVVMRLPRLLVGGNASLTIRLPPVFTGDRLTPSTITPVSLMRPEAQCIAVRVEDFEPTNPRRKLMLWGIV